MVVYKLYLFKFESKMAMWGVFVVSYKSVRQDPPLYALTLQCTVSPHCALMHTTHTFSYFSAMPRVYTQKNKTVLCGPISRPCTFPPAHWRLILLIHDFSLVIGGKLQSEYLSWFFVIGGKLFKEHSLF